MFEEQCSTYIPNNTAPEGAFSEVIINSNKKKIRIKFKANSGKDNRMWDWFDLKLGAWGAWLAKLGMFLGVAILIGGLLFCCVLPILRSLVVKATARQIMRNWFWRVTKILKRKWWPNGYRVGLVIQKLWVRVSGPAGIVGGGSECTVLSPPSILRLTCPWARHRTPNCSPGTTA